MSVEIEAKIAVHDVPALEQALADCGAVPDGVMLEINTFFDTPDHQLKANDEGLRLRVATFTDGTPAAITITFKGPRAHGKLKSRSEHEVGITDPQEGAALLVALGYKPVMSFEKRRKRFMLDGCEIDLDEMPYLGRFVEIEGPSEDAVMAVRARLGLSGEPLVRASYISLLQSYMTTHQITDDHIRLEQTV